MMTRAIETEMKGMCNLSQGIMDKGIEKGLAKAVTNIMKAMNKTMAEAMDLSGVDEAIRPEVDKNEATRFFLT